MHFTVPLALLEFDHPASGRHLRFVECDPARRPDDENLEILARLLDTFDRHPRVRHGHVWER
jgi:hypothetical protein